MEFSIQQTTDDFTEFESALAEFFYHVPADEWDNKTGEREKDWTLHETLAHLVSIAQWFNEAIEAAVTEKPLVMPNFIRREDLREWNTVQVAALVPTPPKKLVSRMIQELNRTKTRVSELTPEQMDMTAMLPVYNRPISARNLIDFQLSHAGVVHAAQLPRAVNIAPLWTRYSDPLTERQIDRFVRHFSYAYWNTLAPDVNATINFHIEGKDGGQWHLVAAPDGGSSGVGTLPDADYTVKFRDSHTFFGVFTVALPLKEALSSGAMTTRTDWREVFKILRLFSATPPGV